MLKILLQHMLKYFAQRMSQKHVPRVVAVTGTVGKTSARDAIAMVLAAKYRVRKSEKNYNNELGVPLTILCIEGGGGSIFGWIGALARAAWNTFFCSTYPEALVLEFGIDKPGDMTYLTGIVQLDAAVITALGDVPVHVENFGTPETLWGEKLRAVNGLKPTGTLIYNADDPVLVQRAQAVFAQTVSCGISDAAQIHATELAYIENKDKTPSGVRCMVTSASVSVALEIPSLLSFAQLAAPLAGIAVGKAFGIPLETAARILRAYEPPRGRMWLVDGIKNTLIIDDTYNSSPLSVKLALNALGRFDNRRRVAVLGDMLELGEFSEKAHREAGERATNVCDLLITIGYHSLGMAEEAAKVLGKNKVFSFTDAVTAAKSVKNLLEADDIILIKGSQGMRMERIVEAIMASPERASELLVRQDKSWKRKPVLGP